MSTQTPLLSRRLPLLGRQGIIRRRRSLANITTVSHGRKGLFLVRKHSQHILDQLADIICRTLLVFIGVLQVRNHVHDRLEATLKQLFLLLELVNEFGHIINGAFAGGAVAGRLENGFGLFFAQEDVTSRRAGDLLIKVCEREGHDGAWRRGDRRRRERFSLPFIRTLGGAKAGNEA